MTMVDLDTISHNKTLEEVVDILSTRTENRDRAFYRVVVAYFFSVMASTMRARLCTGDRGEIPVNSYVIALSPSGTGKGFSTGIMENEILKDFRSVFVDHTLPMLADNHLWRLAMHRAASRNTQDQAEYDGLAKEYEDTGSYLFTFDSGTTPAVKQVRQKLLLADAGSINYQVDEIGSNLLNSTELLNVFLELYDQGLVKSKLTKNTADNKRTKELEGKTPANMLLYGTPSKLLDGSSVEDHFHSLLETGYARRCLFAWGQPSPASDQLTPEEIYDRLTDPQISGTVQKLSHKFAQLADPTFKDWAIEVDKDVGVELIAYKVRCANIARQLPDHEEIRAAEISHRYFKALKLAGAFSFVDGSMKMSKQHLHEAIKLVEESGEAFDKILNRDKPYMKLARYIASTETEVNHSDLLEALPFYKSSNAARTELITMATAWGYRHHIMIKKTFVDGIEFFSGDTLEETSLDKMTLSYSEDLAYHYEPVKVPFEDLHLLTQEQGFHWATHHFENGHRQEANAKPGFNLAVIDVDGGVSLDTVHELLKDYTFMTYTTKRHMPDHHRFRLILPMNYVLELDANDYVEFMDNLAQWLPFDTDTGTHQRSRKWLSCDTGKYFYSQGSKILDILPFVPKTSRNEDFRKETAKLGSLDNLERWFAQRFNDGNRNNLMIKFALALVDSGLTYPDVEEKVLAFNDKLSNGLTKDELQRTVLVTAAKRYQATP